MHVYESFQFDFVEDIRERVSLRLEQNIPQLFDESGSIRKFHSNVFELFKASSNH